MNVLKIKPDPNCPDCHGEGEQYDIVPWGSTTASMPTFCYCVLDQIPEDDDDSEIELVFDEIEKEPYHTTVYDDYADLLDNEQ